MKRDPHNPIAAEKPGEILVTFGITVKQCKAVKHQSSITFSPFQPRLSQDKVCLASWLPKHRVVVPAGCLDCLKCTVLTPADVVYVIHFVWKTLLQRGRPQESSSLQTLPSPSSPNRRLLEVAEFGNRCPWVVKSMKPSFHVKSCPASPQPHHHNKDIPHTLPATPPVSARNPHPSTLPQLHRFCLVSPLAIKEIACVVTSLVLSGQGDKRSLPLSSSWWNVSLCDTLF